MATRPPLPELPYGTGACYCTTCLQMFRSEAGFDAHRVGDFPTPTNPTNTRRCLTVSEMEARGMCQNTKGQWVTKAYDGPYRAGGEE